MSARFSFLLVTRVSLYPARIFSLHAQHLADILCAGGKEGRHVAGNSIWEDILFERYSNERKIRESFFEGKSCLSN